MVPENDPRVTPPAGAPPAGSPPAGGAPAGAPPAGAPPTGGPSALPAEYAGKSAEEVYRGVSDRYKDYDDLRSRASAWDDVKLKPDEVRAQQQWVQSLLGGLSQGRAVRLTPDGKQIQFIDEKGQLQTASAPAANTDPNAWRADWELLDANTQADRLSGHVFDLANSLIAEKERQFNTRLEQTTNQLRQQNTLFIEVLERWIDNPALKPKDIFAKLAEYSTGQIAPLDLVTRELTAPSEIQRKINEGIAAGIAEYKAANPAPTAAPFLPPSNGLLRHASTHAGEKLSRNQLREKVRTTLSEQGINI